MRWERLVAKYYIYREWVASEKPKSLVLVNSLFSTLVELAVGKGVLGRVKAQLRCS